MDNDYPILTPEKVVVTYPVCAIGSRIMAHVVDLLLIVAVNVAATIGLATLLTNLFGEMGAGGLITFILFVFDFGYFILMETLWNGQTLGKRALGIRVVMSDGTPITFLSAFYRNIVRIADLIPGFYAVGMIAIFTNKDGQRLGDFVAGTIVVRNIAPIKRFTPAPHRYGLHPFEDQVGTLDKMTMEEYFAIKRLCDRFPELPKETQENSLHSVWAPFARSHNIIPIKDVHPVYQMEAVIMKYGREHKLV